MTKHSGLSRNQGIALILALLLVAGALGSGLFSTLSISQTTMGKDADGNPIWIMLMQSTSYNEDIKIFNAGTEIGDGSVLKERVAVSLKYSPPVGKVLFSTSNAVPLKCEALFQGSKNLGITFYPYTSADNPRIEQNALVKVTIGSVEVYNENVSLTGTTTTFSENGIVLSPSFQAYQQNPTLIFKNTAVVTLADGSAYLLDANDLKAILTKNYPTASFSGNWADVPAMIGFNWGSGVCPPGGETEKYNTIAANIRSYGQTAPAQSMGGIFKYNAGNLNFDASNGILTLAQTDTSFAVSNVFTLRIPRQVGDITVWTPHFLQPSVKNLVIDGKIGALAKATTTICNGADIDGYIDVSANALDGGFKLNPATTAVKVGATACVDTYFTLSKAADSFKGRLKVTASSGDNVASKTIDVETTARDVATPEPVDPCIKYPETCKQQRNQTLIVSACTNPIPFIQKAVPTTIGGVSFLGLNWGGTTTTQCAYDLPSMSILLFIIGAAMFIYGDNKQKPDWKQYGVYLAAIGIAGFALLSFFESTFLSWFGGNGILILLAIVVAGYFWTKSKLAALI